MLKRAGATVLHHPIAVIAIVVVGLIALETFEQRIEIRPIQVPKQLADMGYSPEYVADQLARNLREIRDTSTNRTRDIPVSLDWTRGDIVAPGSEFSIRSTAAYLKALIGFPNPSVSGQITREDDVLAMQLRIVKDREVHFRIPSAQVPDCPAPGGRYAGDDTVPKIEARILDLVRLSACTVVDRIEPYALVAYFDEIDEPDAERKAVERIVAAKASADPVDLVLQAGLLAKEGEWDQASTKFQRAANLAPDDAWVFSAWGFALNNEGDYDAAIEKFGKAIEFDPEYSVAYNNWGYSLIQMGEYDAALEKLRKAIDFDPEFSVTYNNFGYALNKKGEYDAAIENFGKAIDLDPQYSAAYNNFGYALNKKGEFDAAIEKLRNAVALDPKNAWPHKNWGVALNGQERYSDAIERFRTALELRPEFPEAYAGLGVALSSLGKNEAAIDAYQKAVALDTEGFAHLEERISELRGGE